jgi:hypothetical protein
LFLLGYDLALLNAGEVQKMIVESLSAESRSNTLTHSAQLRLTASRGIENAGSIEMVSGARN